MKSPLQTVVVFVEEIFIMKDAIGAIGYVAAVIDNVQKMHDIIRQI